MDEEDALAMLEAIESGKRYVLVLDENRFAARVWCGSLLFYGLGENAFGAKVSNSTKARNLAGMLTMWANVDEGIELSSQEMEVAKRLFGWVKEDGNAADGNDS